MIDLSLQYFVLLTKIVDDMETSLTVYKIILTFVAVFGTSVISSDEEVFWKNKFNCLVSSMSSDITFSFSSRLVSVEVLPFCVKYGFVFLHLCYVALFLIKVVSKLLHNLFSLFYIIFRDSFYILLITDYCSLFLSILLF